ncbi:serine/threonine-protein kinase [Nonomuraea africana]|uniref:non-specific serine/threonine protein kinase n=1 Tax=Nonomuraea africana TaxID=46171 RepID=A0ABR9KHA9_9ACTN|nr:protein kinase [Nonomuraea africana]MBE1561396.1 serine/threonine protein kinase [Nonomuraea africana]
MRVGNRYRLLEPIGEGGMGIVWRAHDDLLDRTVAIKEVRYTGIGEERRAQLNQRTVREARAAGRLDHPNVVVVHDVIEEDGRPWIVMQLVRSRSLAAVVRERGPMPVSEAARVGGAVLAALRAAHAAGVLHRDVKPENVLLADDGRVVLTDFGIAAMEAEAGLTATGNLVGTPAYMPPERLNGLPATPASDLWSLGATLHTAVEGRAPYERDSWAATVAAVLRDAPEPPRLAGALAPVISGLLCRDPAMRMGAQEAAARLAALAGTSSPTIERPAPARRAPLRWIVPAALVTATVAGGAVWAATRAEAPPVAEASATPSAPSATPTAPSATPSPSGSPSPGLPEGWRRLSNATGGFSVAVPREWKATRIPGRDSVSVKGPGTPGELIIEWTESGKTGLTPKQEWESLEQEIQAKGQFSGYTRLGIVELTYLGVEAADWEFTRNKGGEMIHVLNRGFRLGDGRPFALYWETPDRLWTESRATLDTILETFRPT